MGPAWKDPLEVALNLDNHPQGGVITRACKAPLVALYFYLQSPSENKTQSEQQTGRAEEAEEGRAVERRRAGSIAQGAAAGGGLIPNPAMVRSPTRSGEGPVYPR